MFFATGGKILFWPADSQEVLENKEIDVPFTLKWQDREGVVYAEIERIIYIANKAFYENKRGNVQKPLLK